MTKYEPVIGIEVHVELNTKTKMFCRCSADYFGKEPNTHTCPICLGLPGALPYANEEAIKKCIQIGLALGCTVNEKSLFERKNYFYPDLPKGYQISQYRWPLCVGGRLKLENGKLIRINRAHQEEDTGKLLHILSGTLIDFNRSGVPLVEVVTEPDFSSSEEVRDYAKKLQQIFRYLGVSNADMEKGDMRLEANVSIRKSNGHPRGGAQDLPNYRVELKNINSFRFMVAAIEYEIRRQTEALEKGEKLTQETRGWNEDKKCTFLQRSKEEAHDYRYFPEPDLPELSISVDQYISESDIIELPEGKSKRFEEHYGIRKEDAKILSVDKQQADFFERVVEEGKKDDLDPKNIANYIINKKIDSSTSAQQIISDIKSKSSGVISNKNELEGFAKEAINENPGIVETYKKGKLTAIQALVGVVMRKTKGKADPSKARKILEKLLS